jgi:hypothetical protein
VSRVTDDDTEALDQFRLEARRWSEALQHGDSDRANQASATCISIADRQDQRGGREALLAPLLEDDEAAVRLFAASLLLESDVRAEATLEELAADPTVGPLRSSASVRLHMWRTSNK